MNHKMLFRIRSLTTIAACVLLAFFCQPGWAQVDVSTLEVAGYWENADALVKQCDQNWAKIEPVLEEYAEAIEKKDQDAIDVKTIGKTYSTAQAIALDGQVLTEMGESAGIDFAFRGNYASKLIEQARDLTRGTAAATKIMGQAVNYKQKTDSKRAKTVQNLDDLIAKSKLEEAAAELREMQDDVNTFILWLSPKDAQAVAQQYAQPSRLINSAIQRSRTEKTVALVSQEIKRQQLDLDALVEAANQAAVEVTTKGTATIGGKQVSGPEVFRQLCQQWELAHGKMLNCMGMAYATGQKLDFPIKDLFGANSQAADWTHAGYDLHKHMQTALVKLIEGSSAHASAAELPQLYAQYVQSIGYLSNRLSDDKAFVTACETALQKLAKQDSAFENRVANYRKATDDILHWRSKIAESAQQSLINDYRPTKTIIGDQKCIPKLTTGLQEAVLSLAEHVGKKTSLQNIYGLADAGSFSGNNDRVFMTTNANLAQQAELEALASDLLITQGQMPLTVKAAGAFNSAQNNDFASLGGAIQSFQVVPMSAGLGKLSPAMATYFPIGELPPDQADLKDMLLRVVIEPEWIQHKYFFVRLK